MSSSRRAGHHQHQRGFQDRGRNCYSQELLPKWALFWVSTLKTPLPNCRHLKRSWAVLRLGFLPFLLVAMCCTRASPLSSQREFRLCSLPPVNHQWSKKSLEGTLTLPSRHSCFFLLYSEWPPSSDFWDLDAAVISDSLPLCHRHPQQDVCKGRKSIASFRRKSGARHTQCGPPLGDLLIFIH